MFHDAENSNSVNETLNHKCIVPSFAVFWGCDIFAVVFITISITLIYSFSKSRRDFWFVIWPDSAWQNAIMWRNVTLAWSHLSVIIFFTLDSFVPSFPPFFFLGVYIQKYESYKSFVRNNLYLFALHRPYPFQQVSWIDEYNNFSWRVISVWLEVDF